MRKEKRKREKKRKEEFFKEQNSSPVADNTMKKWGDAKRGTEVLQFRENRWRNKYTVIINCLERELAKKLRLEKRESARLSLDSI